MKEEEVRSPFGSDGPGNVPLPKAPLELVLAQVRFPVLATFTSDEDAAARAISSALAKDYPLIEEGREVVLTVTPEGVSSAQSGARVWKLTTADGSWRVTFGRSFVSIETNAYTRRRDFTDRLDEVWTALAAVAKPPFVERIGVRYINRLHERRHLEALPGLIRQEILGVLAPSTSDHQLLSTLSEALYQFTDGAALRARWGKIPPNNSFDPTIAPAPTDSWLLDVDAFLGGGAGSRIATNEVRLHADALALRAYQFFRWSVTEKFLETFGGEPE
jgi:uncharacterized protein (TIGR04255 family)